MLSQTRLALAATLFGLLLAACEHPTAPPPELGEQTEATYRLLFNDKLVGHALFIFEVGRRGDYRLEAFTTPTEELDRQQAHEILESSEGHLGENILPRRFEHSVMRDDEVVDLLRFDFDWPGRRVHLQRNKLRETQALLPDTHDRLSYLIAARRLADRGTGSLPLQIVSTEASEKTVLTATGPERIELPLGSFDTTGIYRRTADNGEQRRLWFNTAVSPLPLRIVREWDDKHVDMQLEHIERRDQSVAE